MEHILRLLARHGVTEVCINLHHYADDIRGYFGDGRDFGLQAHYSFEEKLLGTAGGTGGFRELLGADTFVVVSGDALTDVDVSAFVAAHREHGAVATIAVKEVDDPSHYGVVVHDDEGRVVGFQEKPPRAEARSRLCNCGIYAFEPAIFDLMPPGAFVDYAKDVFPALLAADRPFYVWPSRPTGTTSAACASTGAATSTPSPGAWPSRCRAASCAWASGSARAARSPTASRSCPRC